METQNKSIWGKWWEPIRKWFYPAWLAYETIVRFYDYAHATHAYFNAQQNQIAAYIGQTGTWLLNLFCSSGTFVVCAVFLTLPSCFILYHFFAMPSLTGTWFEKKLKRIL